MLLHMKQMDLHKKKILCQIHKVATGIYVTTLYPHIVIFSQIKKYVKIYFSSHIYVTTNQENKITPNKIPWQINKVTTGIHVPTFHPTPYCNLKRYRLKFIYFLFILLSHIFFYISGKKIYTKNRYLAKFMSPPPPHEGRSTLSVIWT